MLENTFPVTYFWNMNPRYYNNYNNSQKLGCSTRFLLQTGLAWDVVKSFFAQYEYHVTTIWRDSELEALQRFGKGIRVPPLANRIREPANRRTQVSEVHVNTRGDRHFDHAQWGERGKKSTIRSSSFCLRIPASKRDSSENAKCNSAPALSRWCWGLICTRQGDSGCGN